MCCRSCMAIYPHSPKKPGAEHVGFSLARKMGIIYALLVPQNNERSSMLLDSSPNIDLKRKVHAQPGEHI